jgi:cell division transport system permease protein
MAKHKAPSFKRNRNPLTWLLRHAQMSVSALGRLAHNPLGTLMTAAVIGIAIALPSGLHLLVDNVRQLGNAWEGSSSISLFLQQSLNDEDAERIRHNVQLRPDVAEARLITKTQAMEEFRQLSGFGEALDLLNKNPLPAVIIVRPALSMNGAEPTEQLAKQLQNSREVDFAQVDLQWVRRFNAITHTLERGISVLAILLGIAILLIVGNTIRLEIQNRHSEIEITKLVGGTNAFIRRPFLYEGIWYGLLGAAIALSLVVLALFLLQGPVQELAGLYASDFSLDLISFDIVFAIILGSPLLGLAGSWLAVGRHLQKIIPE